MRYTLVVAATPGPQTASSCSSRSVARVRRICSATSSGGCLAVDPAQDAAARRSRRPAARSSRGRCASRLRITSGLSSSRTISWRAVDVADALLLRAGRTRRGRRGRSPRRCAGRRAGARPRRRRRRSAAPRSTARPSSASFASSASACGVVRGKPSRMKPSSASLESIRSAITPTITSSGTRSPRSMYSFAVAAQLGLVPHRGAQDVAGRVVGQPQVFLQPLALGSLAGPGRAEEDEVQLRPSRRAYFRKPS